MSDPELPAINPQTKCKSFHKITRHIDAENEGHRIKTLTDTRDFVLFFLANPQVDIQPDFSALQLPESLIYEGKLYLILVSFITEHLTSSFLIDGLVFNNSFVVL